jgi:hypothetical protein
MTHRDFDGFIPSSFLLELANRNPNNLSLVTTILATQKLSQAARNNTVRYRLAAGKAERQIYDAKNATRLPGTRARFEGDKVTGDKSPPTMPTTTMAPCATSSCRNSAGTPSTARA